MLYKVLEKYLVRGKSGNSRRKNYDFTAATVKMVSGDENSRKLGVIYLDVCACTVLECPMYKFMYAYMHMHVRISTH